MAAAAGPEPVGPRLEPCLPFGFQRVDHRAWWHRSKITGIPSGRRLRLPGLGTSTRLTGMALNGSAFWCTLSVKSRFGLWGDRHLAVHARRQTTGVTLGHPPHAQERVGARPQHQLLQTADPCEVPRLRRREIAAAADVRHPQPAANQWRASQRARPLVRSPRRPWSVWRLKRNLVRPRPPEVGASRCGRALRAV